MSLTDHSDSCGNSDVVNTLAGNSCARWYVVQCHPRREAVAIQELRRQGFRAFSPSRLITRRHARRIEIVRGPFFPGYVFILLNLDYDPWHSVNATLGVSRMIAFGDHPSPTPTGFVEALVDRSNESGLLYVPENLNICQSVKILTGPFAELAGTLAHFDDNGRVCVLLDIMGSRIPVALKQASIAA